MTERTARFRLKTERELLSALYGEFVGLWTALLFLGGSLLVFSILNVLIPSPHSFAAIGGMILYILSTFWIMKPKTFKLIHRLSSAMVEMEMEDRARTKKQGEEGE